MNSGIMALTSFYYELIDWNRTDVFTTWNFYTKDHGLSLYSLGLSKYVSKVNIAFCLNL